ncbi:MAG: amino-acid N-acetyltransferase [Opitutales bacterium]|nr:amino-acid N-acetyltransferase [Opitutales bacterium]NRA27982.1 amino-acid N-acetyltransferase [Opitutales bacterium]
MSDPATTETTLIKPTDLRGILKYVPMFRDHVFVISFDGSVVEHENFNDLLLDIAVLHNLNIRVVLVHGIGKQLRDLSAERDITITDAYGAGPTDAHTLALALEASADTLQKFQRGLDGVGLRYAITNAVSPTEVGVIEGQDYGSTGKVKRIDVDSLKRLLGDGLIPILSPIAYSLSGEAWRINADSLAADCAIAMEASKLIFLSPREGIVINGEKRINMPADELSQILEKSPEHIDEANRTKADRSIYALDRGVTRAHIIDGRIYGALLREIFDKVGIGSMIHANTYQEIRKARAKDVQSIYNITRNAARSASLKSRSRAQIEREIEHTWVYEIDGSIIACMQLIPYDKGQVQEIGMVFVQPFYQNRGVGGQLIDYAEHTARNQGARLLIALTTQSYPYFKKIRCFEDGTIEDLPSRRAHEYKANGRNSKILKKTLSE